ncbi:MAG: hypothetical protein WKF60_11055 [Ilumatobacter sp.]
MDLGIDGKLAVDTGGAGEIGYCAARTLAIDGARIISSDTDEQELSDAAGALRDDIGVDVFSAVADLSTGADDGESMSVSALWSWVSGRWRNVFSQDTPVGDTGLRRPNSVGDPPGERRRDRPDIVTG